MPFHLEMSKLMTSSSMPVRIRQNMSTTPGPSDSIPSRSFQNVAHFSGYSFCSKQRCSFCWHAVQNRGQSKDSLNSATDSQCMLSGPKAGLLHSILLSAAPVYRVYTAALHRSHSSVKLQGLMTKSCHQARQLEFRWERHAGTQMKVQVTLKYKASGCTQ